MASKLKLTELLHPDSTVAAITINADNSVTIPTQATTTISTSGNVTVGGTLAVGGGNISPQTGFRNRIINGAMTIDQRNAGASVTPGDSAFTLDRWNVRQSAASKFSVQQNAGSVTPPVGFSNYLGATSLSAYSIASGDAFALLQPIEGFNVGDLAWGTANAQAVTLSFWVRSSLTGTFGGALRNSATDRSYPFSYTISAANTWEYKTITVPGDTSGTWLTNNGVGIRLSFGIGVGTTASGTAGAWTAGSFTSATGATSVVGTNGATFYITGVQLEKGSVATPFEFRSIGQELALCERYYQRVNPTAVGDRYAVGYNATTTQFDFIIFFLTAMRAPPAALEQNGIAGNYSVNPAGGLIACSAVPLFQTANTNTINIRFTVASGLIAGQGAQARASSIAAFLGWSAEL